MTDPNNDFLDLLRPTNAERKRKNPVAPQRETLFAENNAPRELDSELDRKTPNQSMEKRPKYEPSRAFHTLAEGHEPRIHTLAGPAELAWIGEHLAPPPADDVGRNAWFWKVGQDEQIAVRCLEHLGIPRSQLRRGENGVYTAQVAPEVILMLPVIRAGARKLSGPQMTRWQVCLLAEADLIRLEPVELPPLPEAVSTYAHAMRDGLALQLAVNRFMHDHGPAWHSDRWAHAWDGVPRDQAREARAILSRYGVARSTLAEVKGQPRPGWVMEPGTGIHVLEGGKPPRDPERFIPFAGVDPITGEIST